MICVLNIILWVSFCVETAPAAHISKLMDPYVYMATTDVIVLPEDYENDFRNLESTSIGLPEDVYYNAETEITYEASDDTYISDHKEKKSFKRNEDNFYHLTRTLRHEIDTVSTKKLYDDPGNMDIITILGNIHDPWPNKPPRYILTGSTTEYLTMPQSDYSSRKITWKNYFPTRMPTEFNNLYYKPTRKSIRQEYRYEENEKSTLDWQIYKMFTRVPIVTRFGNHYYSELEEFEEHHATQRTHSKKPYSVNRAEDKMSRNLTTRAETNENNKLGVVNISTVYPENKAHAEPLTEIMYEGKTSPKMKIIMNDLKVNETKIKTFSEPSSKKEIAVYKETFTTEKPSIRKTFSKKNMMINKFHSSVKTSYREPATEMVDFMKTFTVEKTSYKNPKSDEITESLISTERPHHEEPASEISGHEITYTTEKKTYLSNKTSQESNAETSDFDKKQIDDLEQLVPSEKAFYNEHGFEMSDYDIPISSERSYYKYNYYKDLEDFNKHNLSDEEQKEPDLVIKMSGYGKSYTQKQPNLQDLEKNNRIVDPNEPIKVNLLETDVTRQYYEPYDQELRSRQGGNKTNVCYQCGLDESGLLHVSVRT
ncbi:hypothetical protein B5X24_HaOG207414 [Helicoverpa armigera]|uniref:Uncharacterized protein n=1 Tax=Helicoverpa armigera TaxID=29058 RepID=A0A2W1BSB5_HELAM|nr:hypothetical protein B5X24_HaOG207414 [Helicoverpa armigera]